MLLALSRASCPRGKLHRIHFRRTATGKVVRESEEKFKTKEAEPRAGRERSG